MTKKTPQLYYVQDKRSVVGNCTLWWCPNNQGYTCNLDEAGLYTADQIRGMRDTDIGWPKELVETLVIRHVRVGHLRQSNAETVSGK